MQQHSRCLLRYLRVRAGILGPFVSCYMPGEEGRRSSQLKNKPGLATELLSFCTPTLQELTQASGQKGKGIWRPPAQHGSLLAPSSIKSQLVREAPESSPSLGTLSTMRLRVESPSVCCTTGEDQGPPFPHPSQCLLTSLQYPQDALQSPWTQCPWVETY